jgi:hypothetical protein
VNGDILEEVKNNTKEKEIIKYKEFNQAQFTKFLLTACKSLQNEIEELK